MFITCNTNIYLLHTCKSIWNSIFLPVRLRATGLSVFYCHVLPSASLPTCLPAIHRSVRPSFHPSVRPSVFPTVHLSIRQLFICPSICPSVPPSFLMIPSLLPSSLTRLQISNNIINHLHTCSSPFVLQNRTIILFSSHNSLILLIVSSKQCIYVMVAS